MAKEEEKKEQTTEAPAEAAEDSKAPKGGKGGLVGLAIKALIVLVLAGGVGFGVGKFINAPGKAQATEEATEPQAEQDVPSTDDSSPQNQAYQYIDFGEVTSNLNEPQMARYIMATIQLAISADDNKKEIGDLIDKEKPRLKSWLTTYFGGCTLNDVRGTKHQNRIRREICDRFNELLWPGQKPLIREVLFGKFAIQ